MRLYDIPDIEVVDAENLVHAFFERIAKDRDHDGKKVFKLAEQGILSVVQDKEIQSCLHE